MYTHSPMTLSSLGTASATARVTLAGSSTLAVPRAGELAVDPSSILTNAPATSCSRLASVCGIALSTLEDPDVDAEGVVIDEPAVELGVDGISILGGPARLGELEVVVILEPLASTGSPR